MSVVTKREPLQICRLSFRLHPPPRIPSLRPPRRAINLLLNPLNTPTRIQIRSIWALHINILNLKITANRRARANQIPDLRLILLTRRTAEVPDRNVANSKLGRKLIAQRNILLPIALRDFDGVVDVRKHHGVVGDVLDGAQAAASLEVAGECGCGAGPDFDAGAVRGVGHADVVDVYVLDVVDFSRVLA
jgi:hypothetical protein